MPTANKPAILELGPEFYDPVVPAKFPSLTQRFINDRWAARIGMSVFTSDEWMAHFARFEPLQGNLTLPLALRYHGHQFRHYNPNIGDGRGFLYAQVRDVDGRLLDLGTKGSGTTPYSRRGDGRLTLKGAMREVLATEMLEALGVNTSKSFAVFETGESLERHDEPSPTRGAVLTRLSHSHIRYGTFQRQAYLQKPEQTFELLNYCIRHYYPELSETDPKNRPAAFVKAVAERAADTCAGWMIAGFVHGVLNTDNMNITGESFDYGPYRFSPVHDRQFTAAYFDESGLYAYGRQPESVMWNLEQLGASFLPLFDREGWSTDSIVESIDTFPNAFNLHLTGRFLNRLGLHRFNEDDDEALFTAVFDFLDVTRVSFDQFFFDWYGGVQSEARADRSPIRSHYSSAEFEKVRTLLRKFKHLGDKLLDPPYFANVTPCTLLIDEIEDIWRAIDTRDDWSIFNAKILAIREMGRAYGRDV